MKQTSKKMEQLKESTQSNELGLSVNKQEFNSIEYKEVKKTPFTLVKRNEEVLITIGGTVVSDIKFKTWEEAKKYINKMEWELVAVTAMVLADKYSKLNKEV